MGSLHRLNWTYGPNPNRKRPILHDDVFCMLRHLLTLCERRTCYTCKTYWETAFQSERFNFNSGHLCLFDLFYPLDLFFFFSFFLSPSLFSSPPPFFYHSIVYLDPFLSLSFSLSYSSLPQLYILIYPYPKITYIPSFFLSLMSFSFPFFMKTGNKKKQEETFHSLPSSSLREQVYPILTSMVQAKTSPNPSPTSSTSSRSQPASVTLPAPPLDPEEVEDNSFYIYLRSHFNNIFIRSMVVCIPHSRSLGGLVLTKDFIGNWRNTNLMSCPLTYYPSLIHRNTLLQLFAILPWPISSC